MQEIKAMEIKGNFSRNVLVGAGTGLLALAVLFLVVIIRDDFIRKDYSGLRNQLAKHFLFKDLMAERDVIKVRARAMQLNFYLPDFTILKKIVKDPANINASQLEAYKTYYEKAADFFPEIAEIQGMLGFIYFHLGDETKAKMSYRRAIELNPGFFWFHYNFGVVFFKNGEFDKAAVLFKQALNTNFKFNLEVLTSSGVYQQIFWPDQTWQGFSAEQSLKKAYRECERLLKVSETSLKSSSPSKTSEALLYLF